MKNFKFIAVSLLILNLASCKKDAEASSKKIDSAAIANPEKAVEPELHKELYGIYSGDFEGREMLNDDGNGIPYESIVHKLISLKINRITRDSVYGHSIVNGNQRPFRGIFNENTNSFVLDEPGNDKTDGRFEVKINSDSLTGNWSAFNKSAVKSPVKKLKLLRREFAYNPNLMLDPNSELVDWNNPKTFVQKYTDPDTHKTEKYNQEKYRVASPDIFKLNGSKQQLTENELKNLKKLDLQIIRNSIFARHGYSFKKATYRDFFEQTDWYIPVSDNVDNDLTPLEKENIALLNRMEQYANDHYESFGR